MKTSTSSPNASHRKRFERIQRGGCIACRIQGLGHVPTQIHHLTITGRHGGKRIGHEATVGLCPWHHQGQPPSGIPVSDARLMLGPSLALQPRRFREEYGHDGRLLEYQEALLARQGDP